MEVGRLNDERSDGKPQRRACSTEDAQSTVYSRGFAWGFEKPVNETVGFGNSI